MTKSPITRILIIHGYASSGPKHWQTWLARECEKAGLETHYPDLPNPYNPDVGEWMAALRAELPDPDERTALVGHSLGCAAIFHLLKQEHVRTVGDVVLVAPAHARNVAQSRQAYLAPFYQGMDYANARKKAGRIDLFVSDEDVWMSMADSKAMARELGARLHVFHDAGHLSINAGYHTFPEVLDVILAKD